MRRLLLPLAGLLVLGLGLAWAQTVHNPSNVIAVCAYNSSPPTASSGAFILVQCDSTGHIQ